MSDDLSDDRAALDEAFVQALLSAVPAYVTRLDSDDRVRFLKLTSGERAPTQIVGTHVFELIAPEFHPEARACFEKVRASGQTASYVSTTPTLRGEPAIYRNHVAPVCEADGGVGLCLVGVDITRDRAREGDLARHESWLASAVEATGLALWSINLHGGEPIWSGGMHALTGLDEPLGLDAFLERIVHPDDRAGLNWNNQPRLDQQTFRSEPHRIIRADREVRWVVHTGRFHHDDDGPGTRATGVTLDVTDRQRRAEEREQINRAQTVAHLTAGVAHNFNNMLMAMTPTLELLRDVVPAAHQSTVDDALVAARSSAAMVRQLMIATGTPAGERERAPARVATAVRSLVGLTQQALPEGAELSTDEIDDEIAVPLSENELHQVLWNLLVNAREALEHRPSALPGRPRMGVRAWTSHDTVTIAVEDNGPGIAPDAQRRIFDPFYSTKPAAGHGLGLTSATALVKQRGGRLEVQSAPGEGTCFLITLPRVSPPSDLDTPPRTPPPTNAGWRVLLVDDDRSVRRVTARVLVSNACTVTEAGSVDEAEALLRKASADSFDVVLLDQTMPLRPGVALIPVVRERAPSAKVLLFTGEQADVAPGLVDGVVVKPVTIQELLDAIQDAVDA